MKTTSIITRKLPILIIDKENAAALPVNDNTLLPNISTQSVLSTAKNLK